MSPIIPQMLSSLLVVVVPRRRVLVDAVRRLVAGARPSVEAAVSERLGMVILERVSADLRMQAHMSQILLRPTQVTR
jgi:hypothetical protein